MKSFSRADYQAIYVRECANEYPEIDAFERRAGYALDRTRLQEAARVLACPLKVNPPNWQHGRVIYAAVRHYLRTCTESVTLFDCGTAKGFSALCMAFALVDANAPGRVISVDVIDPKSRVARNSVADLGDPYTIYELLEPWREANRITFLWCTGAAWLQRETARVHCAFIDGKHAHEAVRTELQYLSARQSRGDLALFDDLQIPGVARALKGAKQYRIESLQASPERRYAIGWRI